MYPRNAASPPRISVGAVVQISDGAVQSSGVSVAVMPEGGVSAPGSGTTEYDNGIVLYTPTQAETNSTAFIVIAYKTGCFPVDKTVITTAASTAGQAAVDWSAVTNKPTIGTSTLDAAGVRAAVGLDGADLDEQLAAIYESASCSVGGGAIETEVVCQVGGSPLDGVEVWVTTDEDGENVVAGTQTTDALGKVTFMLDAGDYYVWRQKGGYEFENPQDLTVEDA